MALDSLSDLHPDCTRELADYIIKVIATRTPSWVVSDKRAWPSHEYFMRAKKRRDDWFYMNQRGGVGLNAREAVDIIAAITDRYIRDENPIWANRCELNRDFWFLKGVHDKVMRDVRMQLIKAKYADKHHAQRKRDLENNLRNNRQELERLQTLVARQEKELAAMI